MTYGTSHVLIGVCVGGGGGGGGLYFQAGIKKKYAV